MQYVRVASDCELEEYADYLYSEPMTEGEADYLQEEGVIQPCLCGQIHPRNGFDLKEINYIVEELRSPVYD